MTLTIERKLRSLKDQANHHQHKMSALVLYKGRPISFGTNDQTKTHPRIKKYSDVKTMHAEMAAIFKIKNQDILKGCSVIVFREDRHGNLAMAKPCPACELMMKDLGIKDVTYTTANGWVNEKIK